MSLFVIFLTIGLIFLEFLIVRLIDSFWPNKVGQKIIIAVLIVLDIALIAFLSTLGQKPVAHISSHLEGNQVPSQIILQGTYENLDDDTDLWVYVYSPTTGTYYFSEAALYYNAQRWNITDLQVGSVDESDAGKSFELGVLAANVQASQQLRAGTDEIPDGASLVSERITLRRIGEIVSATPQPTMTPTPALGIGSTDTRAKDGAVMMYVPAGEFDMGSNDRGPNEQPIHTVTIDDFWIDQTEVTNGQFTQFVAATSYETTAEQEGRGYAYADGSWGWVNGVDWLHPSGPNSDIDGLDEHPAVQVSWYDAVAYCEWAGGRLPTEAEWEYAASGTDGNIYPWGNESPNADLLNYNQNVGKTTAIGSYSPNGESWVGASDMAGNVWEWTSTLYQSYPYNADDGRENASSTNVRVLRGGLWHGDDYYARAASRVNRNPAFRSNGIGFRCAQE